jgi:hypothetical protein
VLEVNEAAVGEGVFPVRVKECEENERRELPN